VRKVEPLNRALAGAQGWITGLRADQSTNRSTIALVSVDAERNLLKLSPLADWTRDAALAYATAHEVPINPLHAQGFGLDRLRAVHARHRAGRRRTRRPLVVGSGRQEGMRTACAKDRRCCAFSILKAERIEPQRSLIDCLLRLPPRLDAGLRIAQF
jgi:3'-phosphoadenosine 5'-phosphosulfate sulfotransferase (PAPS reductase)/FAD synthetase